MFIRLTLTRGDSAFFSVSHIKVMWRSLSNETEIEMSPGETGRADVRFVKETPEEILEKLQAMNWQPAPPKL